MVDEMERVMVRLFKIYDADGKPKFFYSKKQAKTFRDASNNMRRVFRGPDHWRGETQP